MTDPYVYKREYEEVIHSSYTAPSIVETRTETFKLFFDKVDDNKLNAINIKNGYIVTVEINNILKEKYLIYAKDNKIYKTKLFAQTQTSAPSPRLSMFKKNNKVGITSLNEVGNLGFDNDTFTEITDADVYLWPALSVIKEKLGIKEGGKSTRKSLDKCTVAELKEKAKKRGVKVTGLKKDEILAKLRK